MMLWVHGLFLCILRLSTMLNKKIRLKKFFSFAIMTYMEFTCKFAWENESSNADRKKWKIKKKKVTSNLKMYFLIWIHWGKVMKLHSLHQTVKITISKEICFKIFSQKQDCVESLISHLLFSKLCFSGVRHYK